MAINDGVIYAIERVVEAGLSADGHGHPASGGRLRWARHLGHEDGGFRWEDFKTVGTGWGDFSQVFSGGNGVIYAIERVVEAGLSADGHGHPASGGRLRWARHLGHKDGSFRWEDFKTVGTGWGDFSQVFSGGNGIIYAIERVVEAGLSADGHGHPASGGRLRWARHLGHEDGSSRWEDFKTVGTGWGDFSQVFSTGDGVIYAIERVVEAGLSADGHGHPASGGRLRWARHLGHEDGSFQWQDFKTVGFGWRDFSSVFSGGNYKPAFNVNGEIRAKYEALGGAAGPLGLPVTDEVLLSDGGRFNHFERGSIYWSPRTGPMTVHGTVRDRWAASGWEAGPLGYPVQDQARVVLRDQKQQVEWCRFENGLIAGDARGGMPAPMALQSPAETLERIAPPALLTYAELGALLGGRLNAQFVASPDNVAMRPGVVLTGVSGWRYDFNRSISRSVGFRFRAFHDNGLGTDTNFSIALRLRFELVPSLVSFTEPTTRTLVAILEDLSVGHDGGAALAQVYATVESEIGKAFYSKAGDDGPHDAAHPDVPSGALFVADVPMFDDAEARDVAILDVLVTAAGDLQVLVNPLNPTGSEGSYAYLRQRAVQDALDSLT